MSEITKVCPGCGKTFSHESARQGAREFCSKSCRLKKWSRERRLKQPEKVRAEASFYYKKHRPKRLASMKKWGKHNSAERSAKMKKWYVDNQDEIRARRKAYHALHRDEHNARVRLQNQKARVTHPWRGLLHAAKSRARLKKLPFTLTKEWAAERWTGKCEVTGLEFKLGLMGTGPQVWSPSIDRIKPELGYTPDNCRFVLVAVNIFKMTGTDEDMVLIARAIVDSNGS